MKKIRYGNRIIDIDAYSDITINPKIENGGYHNINSVSFVNHMGNCTFLYIDDDDDFKIIKDIIISTIDIDFDIEIEKIKDVEEEIDLE